MSLAAGFLKNDMRKIHIQSVGDNKMNHFNKHTECDIWSCSPIKRPHEAFVQAARYDPQLLFIVTSCKKSSVLSAGGADDPLK